MTLTRRIYLAMITVTLVTALAVGSLVYYRLESRLQQRLLEQMQTQCRILTRDVFSSVDEASRDVLAVAAMRVSSALVGGSGGTAASAPNEAGAARDTLAQFMAGVLEAKPHYTQFRIIGAAGEGFELVRVDRASKHAPVRVIPHQELQPKGARDYFQEALALEAGEIYISRIELNREHGVLSEPHIPVLRIATPLIAQDGTHAGVVIINLNMEQSFERVRADTGSGLACIAVNTQGDYLMHPDRSLEFGFDLGTPHRIQEDFPGLSDLQAPGAYITRDRAGSQFAVALFPYARNGDHLMSLILMVPFETLVQPLARVRNNALMATLAAAVVAVLFATVLARSLTASLRTITERVTSFDGSGELDMPVGDPGEIGVLSRAFVEMADGVRERTLALEREVEARAHAEEQFRLAIESAPSGMAIIDSDGNVQLVNREFERIFGYDRSEVLGQGVEMFVPQASRGQHRALREGYHAQPDSRLMGQGRELYGLRRNGEEFPIEVGLNPIHFHGVTVVLSVITDISERKESERRIQQYTLDLERSNQELESFAYVASHDLQEPLRMVASYVELLARRYEGKLDEKADKYIYYAVDGATRMKQLINDLLEFSRVNTRGKELVETDTELALQRALRALELAIKETGAKVTSDTLPKVVGDIGQLTQVFQNLIGNGIKFRGENSPAVHIGATVADGMCEFSVRDNGIGIDPQYSERVFQMFQRLNTRDQYEGTGIGLAISKRIIERHGGGIWLESDPGNGSTFFFTIPVV